jgi:hypothetical protein
VIAPLPGLLPSADAISFLTLQSRILAENSRPSLAIDWDSGGGNAHIRYLRQGQPIREIPLTEAPSHSGAWDIHWMAPEPMHWIEVVEWPKDSAAHASDPPELRIEIKIRP